MKKKYSNSLDNVMTRYKERINNVHVIDKEDIIGMFNNKEFKKKDKFRIFK